jgi:histidinol dehydrogenase
VISILQGESAWNWLEAHATSEQSSRTESVRAVIAEVRSGGDEALLEFARKFGDPLQIELSKDEVQAKCDQLNLTTKHLLERAAHRIKTYAEGVMGSLRPSEVQGDGFTAGLRFQPVESVGCYVPGGRYPLPSTALMTTIPARVAGVKNISITCPSPHPAVLYAASLAQADRYYCIGGSQAVAALALGTTTVGRVDMIVGPGNAYVTEAKRQLQGTVGIDMLAGPSEVAIIADQSAEPEWIALDLLAQAEHDPLAKVCLMTDCADLAKRVQLSIVANAEPKPDFISQSLGRSALLVFGNLKDCVQASNSFAPEHLQVYLDDSQLLDQLTHYGALFIGPHSAVALGDYGSGPNHTLPTERAARFSSGLSPLTFLRTQSWLRATDAAQQLIEDTVAFAELEGLHLHAASARARLRN